MDIRIVYTHIYTFTTGDPVTSLNANKTFPHCVQKSKLGEVFGVMISVNVLVLKYAETTEPNNDNFGTVYYVNIYSNSD